MLLQLLIYGLQLGCAYALLAIGYSMVYGIIGMINFAHGDFMMVGAYVAFYIFSMFTEIPTNVLIVVGVLIIAMFCTGWLGVLIERVAYKPLRSKARLTALITAIGVSIFLENFPRALPFIGPNAKSFPTIFPVVVYQWGSVTVTNIQLIMIIVTIVLCAGMYLFVQKTTYGKQMRAVCQDKNAASLMGINVNGVISLTFFIGAALAALSGCLYSCRYPTLTLTMGSTMGMKSFICAVFGGIGDIRGAMLGGIVMGIIEIFASYVNSEFAYGVSFIVLILILLFRPEGILGHKTIEKV